MKNVLFAVLTLTVFVSACKSTRNTTSSTASARSAATQQQIGMNIDLQNVLNDKVRVTATAPAIKSDSIQFQFPRIIPGTYANSVQGYSLVEEALNYYRI